MCVFRLNVRLGNNRLMIYIPRECVETTDDKEKIVSLRLTDLILSLFRTL